MKELSVDGDGSRLRVRLEHLPMDHPMHPVQRHAQIANLVYWAVFLGFAGVGSLLWIGLRVLRA
jgi:hypothetical protein